MSAAVVDTPTSAADRSGLGGVSPLLDRTLVASFRKSNIVFSLSKFPPLRLSLKNYTSSL
jgi:hypothetical protein